MEVGLREQWIEEAWGKVVAKVEKSSKRIGATFPYASLNGKYIAESADWWTSGFWPGLLWLIYRENGNEDLLKIAVSCEDQMDEPLLEYEKLHHDVGFMWSLSSVAQYKLVGTEMSKRRGLMAASHLAGRYNAKGQFIRAWNGENQQGWAIIDCLLNLPLLYWASETTNDPRFRHIAVAHADTVLREFIRLDGSSHHIVCFDPETGERIEDRGGQGFSPDSAWSRGTAWALYGMALSYRYTGHVRFLNAAKHVADFFIANMPADRAPYWDFRAPEEEELAYDTSAAACAASGLLEISRFVPKDEVQQYEEAAKRILRILIEHYASWDDDEEGIITKATANFPKRTFVNVPIIYGDYFFAEAITKLRGRTELFW
ncbi:glycosyl hydrolase [Paenibacillus psychroresistens]|uniref:Glycosyl hydrolase n=1 Tax=Paenibacillus psychroresistens TaxID=1778678 RepID=A0A6B8RRU6_9BACL|nr:glycoside hydrolase family 88 protein [Paenibacillus psychroresistens]QGQ99121.1 glycosyl hydrolase [Paenibacillus psychroresistens]